MDQLAKWNKLTYLGIAHTMLPHFGLCYNLLHNADILFVQFQIETFLVDMIGRVSAPSRNIHHWDKPLKYDRQWRTT